MQSKYIPHEYLGDIDFFASEFDRDEMGRLAQFFHHYHNGIILFGRCWKSSDEIHGDGFPCPFWDW
jgi:hypothetical protein